MGSNEGAFFLPPRISNSLKADWQRHVLASSGYLELGMFDAAALVFEEIAPEDKTRNEVPGARVNLYMAAKKWDMVAAVASHLVKVDPQTPGWWISLAYALRCTESIEKAEAILLRAQAIHLNVAMIAFTLACYASVAGRMEEAKERLRHAINLDKGYSTFGARRPRFVAVVGPDHRFVATTRGCSNNREGSKIVLVKRRQVGLDTTPLQKESGRRNFISAVVELFARNSR